MVRQAHHERNQRAPVHPELVEGLNQRFLKATTITSLLGLALVSCTHLDYPLEKFPSQNQNSRISLLVMHFTASDFTDSLKELTVPDERRVSSHYLIPEKNDPSYPHDELKVFQLVEESERAWHAGTSYWDGRQMLNDQSIGIEIVNRSYCVPPPEQQQGNELCFFYDYDPEQIALVTKLARNILARYPDITPTHVVGHSDIAPLRKADPGPRFPWQALAKAGIGAWYDNDRALAHFQRFSGCRFPDDWMMDALSAYGYGNADAEITNEQLPRYIEAFQAHFLPWHMNGQADDRTVATLLALLEKYYPEKFATLLQQAEALFPAAEMSVDAVAPG